MAKSVSLPWKAANPFWLLLTETREVSSARIWIWKPSLGMCGDLTEWLLYIHVLIYNQIEIFWKKKKIIHCFGCIVNNVRGPTWLHVSHNPVSISLFPEGDRQWGWGLNSFFLAADNKSTDLTRSSLFVPEFDIHAQKHTYMNVFIVQEIKTTHKATHISCPIVSL